MGTAVRIVPMTDEHIAALMPYEKDLFGADSWSSASYRREVHDTKHRCYLAAEDESGALLGWAGVLTVADQAEILTVGVIPAAQRQGIGAALLDALHDEARRRGAGEVFLEVRIDNIAAQQMYRADGYEQIGVRRGYYDLGRVDGVVMRREL
jgi:ribosomal-protein-alanine N-acetyltransferase